jgi:hypothetical protein
MNSSIITRVLTFKLLSYVGHFLVYPLFLELPYTGCTNICNELHKGVSTPLVCFNTKVDTYLRQTSHVGRHAGIKLKILRVREPERGCNGGEGANGLQSRSLEARNKRQRRGKGVLITFYF